MTNSADQRVCAYCGAPGPLTSEHVWPRGILRRTNYNVRYSMKAGKTFSGDIVIKDVCRECNNGPLAKLDDYFCNIYDGYFFRVPQPRVPIVFEYDFSLLMRCLLKISYNSSRSTDIDAELLSKYAPVLISEFPTSPIHAGAFVGTAKAVYLKSTNRKKRTKLNPMGMRCGPMIIDASYYFDWCATRAVVINGFMFTVVLMRQPTVQADIAGALYSRIYGIPLLPNGSIEIPPPTKTTLDFYQGVQQWPRGHR